MAAPPLFVLVRPSPAGAWALVAGPTDTPGAVTAVQTALTNNPGGRAVVLALARSFTCAPTVNEDSPATAG